MIILIQVIFVIAVIVTILAFFKPKDKEENHTTPKPIGLYLTKVNLKGNELYIRSEVRLNKEYSDDEISVTHTKLFGVPRGEIDDVMEILLNEHTLISKKDVKWVKM